MAKEFQQLTIKDSFMFSAVMENEETCRQLLEIALSMKILSVTIITEKTLSYHPNYHGVRLDVWAEEHGTRRRFNVEMQVEKIKNLPQRVRYYHTQMNIDALAAGKDYDDLPDTYVIFICDFAPFDTEKCRYRYTFRTRSDEDGWPLGDGSISVILSTKGKNDDEVPKELLRFLKYVENPQHPTEDTVSDQYVRSLDRQVAAIKRNRDWEAKFVLFKEMMNKEREAGRQEGLQEGLERGLRKEQANQRECILAFLGALGSVPQDIADRVSQENDPEVLKRWLMFAPKAESFEDFRKRM